MEYKFEDENGVIRSSLNEIEFCQKQVERAYYDLTEKDFEMAGSGAATALFAARKQADKDLAHAYQVIGWQFTRLLAGKM